MEINRKVSVKVKVLDYVIFIILNKISQTEKKKENEDRVDFLKHIFVELMEIKEEYERRNTKFFKLSTIILAILVIVTGNVINVIIPSSLNYILGFLVATLYFNIIRILK